MKLLIEESNQSRIVDVYGQMAEGIPRGRGGAQGRPELPTMCRMWIGRLIKQNPTLSALDVIWEAILSSGYPRSGAADVKQQV